jgi:hypothetical protein
VAPAQFASWILPSKNPPHCTIGQMPNLGGLSAGSIAFQKVKVLEERPHPVREYPSESALNVPLKLAPALARTSHTTDGGDVQLGPGAGSLALTTSQSTPVESGKPAFCPLIRLISFRIEAELLFCSGCGLKTKQLCARRVQP